MKVRRHPSQPVEHRGTRHGPGFTLLELVVVLFIMVLFVSVAAFSFEGVTDEQVLRTPGGELQRVAREAVRRAGMYEEAEVIVFDQRGFGVRYRDDPELNGGAPDSRHWLRRVELPQDMQLKMKRWGQKEWQPAAGQRWIVQPSGLCEPVTVRLERGRSYLEMQFNPLTGGVADERMSIQP
jgi:prepilin-type N-terminal cleavage/methylation domain-containing protein